VVKKIILIILTVFLVLIIGLFILTQFMAHPDPPAFIWLSTGDLFWNTEEDNEFGVKFKRPTLLPVQKDKTDTDFYLDIGHSYELSDPLSGDLVFNIQISRNNHEGLERYFQIEFNKSQIHQEVYLKDIKAYAYYHDPIGFSPHDTEVPAVFGYNIYFTKDGNLYCFSVRTLRGKDYLFEYVPMIEKMFYSLEFKN
jgi:hypothetical protein